MALRLPRQFDYFSEYRSDVSASFYCFVAVVVFRDYGTSSSGDLENIWEVRFGRFFEFFGFRYEECVVHDFDMILESV